MMRDKILYGILGIIAFVGLGWIFRGGFGVNPNCQVENCHGLEVSCGPKSTKSCTTMYAFGDRCRRLVKCQIKGGKCQKVESQKFFDCRDCVNACQEKYGGNYSQLYDCEGKCD